MKTNIYVLFSVIFCATVVSFLFVLSILHEASNPSPVAVKPASNFRRDEVEPLGRRERGLLVDGKKIAYAITVTKDGPYLDGAAVLFQSIISAKSRYEFDMIAIIHPGVQTTREPLRKLGYILHEFQLPIKSSEIEGTHLRETIDKSGCCGAAELLKLRAYQLEQYYRILLLDMDSVIVKNIDHLFEKDKSLIFTWDHAMDTHGRAPPVQGGFLLIKPDNSIYNQLIDIVREGDFRKGSGWGGTNIGWCWGGQTVQGLLSYYYTIIRPGTGLAIDPCAYNSMATTKNCSKIAFERVYSVHFTACQKPWECHKGKEGICRDMHTFWWKLRAELEYRNDLSITPRCCNDLNYCGTRYYIPLKPLAVRKQFM